jgi:hypothetical protein
MRRIMLIAGCIGSCALGTAGVAATPALAAAPEWGKCVEVAKGTGVYRGKNCLTVAAPGRGKFVWQAEPTAKPKYALSIEGATLSSSGGRVIKCESGEGEGEYTGAKTTSIAKPLFSNCKVTSEELPLFASYCQNVGNFRGEITLNEVVGELGYIEHALRTKVGVDLKPKSGSAFGLFECGGASEVTEHGMGTGTFLELTGSVIGRIKPINRPFEELFTYFTAAGTKQTPEQFEGGEVDTLTVLNGLVAKTPEPTSFTSINESLNEEPVEIKGR